MADYWDTACLLKLYCEEEDSDDYIALVEKAAEAVVTSQLTETELYFALQQKAFRNETQGHPVGELFSLFQSDLSAHRIRLVPWGNDVFQKARELADTCYAASPAVVLRILDGIHLASAVLASCKRLHSTDSRMRQAIQRLDLFSGF